MSEIREGKSPVELFFFFAKAILAMRYKIRRFEIVREKGKKSPVELFYFRKAILSVRYKIRRFEIFPTLNKKL